MKLGWGGELRTMVSELVGGGEALRFGCDLLGVLGVEDTQNL